jgi:hypothetical protein
MMKRSQFPIMHWGFPCCVRFPCVHAAATTPVQRLGLLLAHLAQPCQPSAEGVAGSACTSTFSRLARRSLALRPAHCVLDTARRELRRDAALTTVYGDLSE